MEKYSTLQYDKDELVKLFAYKMYDILYKYGITKIVLCSGGCNIDLKHYNSVSQLGDAITGLSISSILVETSWGISTFVVNEIDNFCIDKDYICIETREKKCIFRKEQ